MNPLHGASIASFLALGIAWPAAVQAANWQVYLPEGNISNEIDADSVRVVNGLVAYTHRKRLVEGADARFDRALPAVADCAGRRLGNVAGAKLLFSPVQEGTWQASQVDAACRIAGLPTTPGPAPEWQDISDGMSINVRSLKVHDGLVFYDYTLRHNKVASGWETAVVECATRRRSQVAGDHYTLQRMIEGGRQARQAEGACRLAQLPMPPGPTPAQVDFAAAISPDEAGDDNLRYDIVRTGITLRDGLVHFQYTTSLLSDGSLAQEDQRVSAVVDCAGQRRADEVGGKFDLQPVVPGTRGALQVGRVCAMAAAR